MTQKIDPASIKIKAGADRLCILSGEIGGGSMGNANGNSCFHCDVTITYLLRLVKIGLEQNISKIFLALLFGDCGIKMIATNNTALAPMWSEGCVVL